MAFVTIIEAHHPLKREAILSEIVTDSEKRISEQLVSLIDILFAVAVGDSIFTLVFSNNTIIEWPIFYNIIITIPNIALIVAYAAVILSWIGYHSMINQFPYRSNLLGKMRFWIDILIVFIYISFIYSKDNLSLFLFWFIPIFLLYAIGDCIRDIEYNSRVSQKYKSFLFAFLFAIIWVIYYKLNPVISGLAMSYLVLLLNLSLLFFYRFWKFR